MNLPAHRDLLRTSLAAIATRYAGASRVFHRHHLDFCCRGHETVATACAARSIDPERLLCELDSELRPNAAGEDWETRSVADLLDHLESHYHDRHRAELPRLVAMARKVESVHGERASCPSGLANHLQSCAEDLERHMQKEEQILFPMLRAGHGSHAAGPIQVMEQEHQDHGANLRRLRELAHDFEPPQGVCSTWRALYLGLEEFERELMQHIHLENHVLFPRVLAR